MSDLIDWKQDLPVVAETLADIVGVESPEETYAYHRAAIAQKQEQNAIEQLSDKELMEQWQREAQKLEALTLEQRQIDSVHRFIQATPELVLNQKTMTRIDAYLKSAGLDASDPSHFDQAYRALAARHLLDIDESKRARTPYQRYTEADLQNMDLGQLEELARQSR